METHPHPARLGPLIPGLKKPTLDLWDANPKEAGHPAILQPCMHLPTRLKGPARPVLHPRAPYPDPATLAEGATPPDYDGPGPGLSKRSPGIL